MLEGEGEVAKGNRGKFKMLTDDDDFFIDAAELGAILDEHPSTLVQSELPVTVAAEPLNDAEQDGSDAEKRERRERKKARKEARRKEKKEKKSSKKVSRFIDDAASEGEAESDDREDADDYEVASSKGEDYIKNHKSKRHTFMEGDENMTEEEIARAIEQRHALQSGGGRKRRRDVEGVSFPHLDGGEMAFAPLVPRKIPIAKRFSPAFLPRETDPKVFAVKCKAGMTRILVARIVNKCYHFRIGQNDERKKLDLGILAVFALEHSKEYIYVEAYRQLFVEQALTGLVGLYRYNIKMVDPNELMQLMEPRATQKVPVRVGTFVRVRSHKPYQGDLGQVLSVDADGKRATLKLVPREDFVDKCYAKPVIRLPQRFFNPQLAAGTHVDGDTYRWGDAVFDQDGYIIKTISVRGLFSGDQMVAPSTEELAFFLQNSRDQIAIAASAVAASGAVGLHNNQREYKLGEVVRVISGQLANAVGTIVDVTLSSNTVKIACRIPGRSPLEVRAELSNCERHFVAGNHIGVEEGPHQGRTGTVIKVISDSLLAVLGDGDATEFEVRCRDCRQSRLMSIARHSLGAWRLFDLVMVNGSTAACIVRCEPRSLQVLTTDNVARSIAPSEVTKMVRSAGRPAIDCMQNPVSRGSVVTIKATNERIPICVVGTVGTVEQLFDQTLFVRCNAITEHSGLVAVPPSLVQLVGGKTNAKKVAPTQHLALVRANGHYAKQPDDAKDNAHAGSANWDTRSELL